MEKRLSRTYFFAEHLRLVYLLRTQNIEPRDVKQERTACTRASKLNHVLSPSDACVCKWKLLPCVHARASVARSVCAALVRMRAQFKVSVLPSYARAQLTQIFISLACLRATALIFFGKKKTPLFRSHSSWYITPAFKICSWCVHFVAIGSLLCLYACELLWLPSLIARALARVCIVGSIAFLCAHSLGVDNSAPLVRVRAQL